MAFQAAGVVVNYFQNRESKKMIEIGRQLEEAAFETNLEAIRLQASESSLDSMISLRKNLGSQIAAQAARGTSSGSGSAFALSQASLSSFNKDERLRKLNLLMNETSLRSGHTMSELKSIEKKSSLDKELFNKTFETVANQGNIDGATKLGNSLKTSFNFGTAT